VPFVSNHPDHAVGGPQTEPAAEVKPQPPASGAGDGVVGSKVCWLLVVNSGPGFVWSQHVSLLSDLLTRCEDLALTNWDPHPVHLMPSFPSTQGLK